MKPDPMLFERSPERYARARPDYPEDLWQRLEEIGIARDDSRVLDIGAGTGQVAGPLVERGAQVDAIEPGAALAGYLRRRYPTVDVQLSTAEDAVYPTASYDGVVCGTALHWVDLAAVLPRIRACLRPGGWFVPFWHVFFDPDAEITPFRAAINEMFGRAPSIEGTPLDEGQWRHALADGGLFTVEEVVRWPFSHRMTSSELVALLRTFNGWSERNVATAFETAEQLGGSVTEHYTTVAYFCRRAS